jgi:hypothetical protein
MFDLTCALKQLDSRTAGNSVAVRRHGLQKILKECEGVGITKVFCSSTFYTFKCKGIIPGEQRFVNIVLTSHPSPYDVEDCTKRKKNYMILIYSDSGVEASDSNPIHQAFHLEQNYLVGQKRVVLTEEMVRRPDKSGQRSPIRIELEEIEVALLEDKNKRGRFSLVYAIESVMQGISGINDRERYAAGQIANCLYSV